MSTDAVSLLASALPDPGQPSILMLSAALGAIAGGTLGRLRGASRDRLTHMTADGGFYGGVFGLACWGVVLAIETL